MSHEASMWALNLAPIPLDPNGRRNPACTAVLVGLANNAGSDGRGAFPSVATLSRYTSLSERTVRTALDRLAESGVIVPTNPAIVAAHISRADRRPQGWDLRLDLVDPERWPDRWPVDNSERGAATAPRRGAPAAPRADHGVQPPPGRGAATAPEPYIEPSISSSPIGEEAALPGLVAVHNQQSTAEVAQQITGEWWERFTPRPSTPFPGQRAIVKRLLDAGWAPEHVRAVLADEQPPLTTHRLEQRLRGSRRRRESTIIPAEEWIEGTTYYGG